jgi:phage gpG-like protein
VKHVEGLGEMALELALRVPEIALELGHGLDKVLERIEMTAKAEFGQYQSAQGPFPAWPELAEATKDDRVHQGYAENEPLLRSGDTRDSVERERDGLEGVVGSKDENLVFHEFGTATIPARPVLGPAAFVNKGAIQRLVGAALVAGLIGKTDLLPGGEVHEGLGYNMRTAD